MGSAGPSEINPATGEPWGLDFPVVTIADMVRAQAMLLDHLGIEQLFAVIGGSMGGMQVLEWASLYPERVFAAVPIATAAHHSAQNIAFHEVGRQAIMADPDWHGGRILAPRQEAGSGASPWPGWRRTSPISRRASCTRSSAAGCRTATPSPTASMPISRWKATCATRASTFVERFDANSYLYITRAMDYFDLAARYGGVLANAFRDTPVRFCVLSFTSDWLYPTAESRRIVHALNAVAANVSFAEIVSNNGHDAFLLDEPEFFRVLGGFLAGAAQHRGLSVRA